MTTIKREQELLNQAYAAIQQGYAPYSGFRVGAAVLTQRGTTYTGCNVENASYGLTVCAERVAIFSAVAAEGPDVEIVEIAVACESGERCSPCGACRQVIAEFNDKARVVYRDNGDTRTMLLDELLPHRFRLRNTEYENQ